MIARDHDGRLGFEERAQELQRGLELRHRGLGREVTGAHEDVWLESPHRVDELLLDRLAEVPAPPGKVEVRRPEEALGAHLRQARSPLDVDIRDMRDADGAGRRRLG